METTAKKMGSCTQDAKPMMKSCQISRVQRGVLIHTQDCRIPSAGNVFLDSRGVARKTKHAPEIGIWSCLNMKAKCDSVLENRKGFAMPNFKQKGRGKQTPCLRRMSEHQGSDFSPEGLGFSVSVKALINCGGMSFTIPPPDSLYTK